MSRLYCRIKALREGGSEKVDVRRRGAQKEPTVPRPAMCRPKSGTCKDPEADGSQAQPRIGGTSHIASVPRA